MSELSKLRFRPDYVRSGLLSNVSLFALAAAVSMVPAIADDLADRPTVWIELGGQLERQTGQASPFVQQFVLNNPDSPAFDNGTPIEHQKPPPFTNGAEGSLTFAPRGTDWSFSVSVRYGRSSGEKHATNQTAQKALLAKLPPTPSGTIPRYFYTTPHVANFSNTAVKQKQSHLLLDFQVGKDVGLGFLGKNSSSIFSIGVRVAQFSSRSSVTVHAIPDVQLYNEFPPSYAALGYYFPGERHRSYSATGTAWRSFHGVGPSLSWKMSTPVLGNESSAILALDGGVNASLLFGRQRIKESHRTSGYYPYGCNCTRLPTYTHAAHATRSRSVTIPNLGGFAGFSLKFPNAKVSFGYKADFFFGAMDGGIDVRRTEDVGFHGPYASVSIGLGG